MMCHDCLHRHVSVTVSRPAADVCLKSNDSAMHVPVDLMPAEPCSPDPHSVVDSVLILMRCAV
jgi:hypothetical protein